jgi:hypothetical protein
VSGLVPTKDANEIICDKWIRSAAHIVAYEEASQGNINMRVAIKLYLDCHARVGACACTFFAGDTLARRLTILFSL